MAGQKRPLAETEFPQPHLLGPPYRWLLPDCRCFYSESIYVKTSLDEKIDRYFKLPTLETSAAEFWQVNADVAGDLNDKSNEVKDDIYERVKAESKRRRFLSATYKHNAAACAAIYRPLHPELFPRHDLPMPDIVAEKPPDVAPGVPAVEMFTTEFLDVWKDVVNGSKQPKGLTHVHAECFEVPVFTKAFCAKLVAEIEHFKGIEPPLPHQWPNNMNRNGCILNEIGMGPFMDRLIYLYLGPLSKAVYGRFLKDGFEAHHSFIVAYSMGGDKGLGVHDDNSEVTINIALRDDFEGASLALYHHARTAHPQLDAKDQYLWKVGAGTMLFHPGEMLHEVLPLQAGRRMGLIIWLRSTKWRSQNGCPLCQKTENLMYAPATGDEGGEVRRLESVGLIPDIPPFKRAANWPAA